MDVVDLCESNILSYLDTKRSMTLFYGLTLGGGGGLGIKLDLTFKLLY